MAVYTVVWEIQVEADNVEQAFDEAWEIICELPENEASNLEVHDMNEDRDEWYSRDMLPNEDGELDPIIST